MSSPAPGFGPLFRSSPVIGLRVEQKHCNMRGALHGGIVATLAVFVVAGELAER